MARPQKARLPLDIFVSNAGILAMGTIDSYSLEDFDRMVAITSEEAGFITGASLTINPLALLTANSCLPINSGRSPKKDRERARF